MEVVFESGPLRSEFSLFIGSVCSPLLHLPVWHVIPPNCVTRPHGIKIIRKIWPNVFARDLLGQRRGEGTKLQIGQNTIDKC